MINTILLIAILLVAIATLAVVAQKYGHELIAEEGEILPIYRPVFPDQHEGLYMPMLIQCTSCATWVRSDRVCSHCGRSPTWRPTETQAEFDAWLGDHLAYVRERLNE